MSRLIMFLTSLFISSFVLSSHYLPPMLLTMLTVTCLLSLNLFIVILFISHRIHGLRITGTQQHSQHSQHSYHSHLLHHSHHSNPRTAISPCNPSFPHSHTTGNRRRQSRGDYQNRINHVPLPTSQPQFRHRDTATKRNVVVRPCSNCYYASGGTGVAALNRHDTVYVCDKNITHDKILFSYNYRSFTTASASFKKPSRSPATRAFWPPTVA